MAAGKEVSGGMEWRVSAPEGSTVSLQPESGSLGRTWRSLLSVSVSVKSGVFGFGKMVWDMGASDPRKVVHCVKVGLALALVSLFYYTRPLYDGVGGAAMWAVMTVVVVFEFTVGGCMYKGVNRAIATLTAGVLAIGVHWIASKSGETAEPIIRSASVLHSRYEECFFLFYIDASAATFSRFIPTIKSRFDYGITIFILTFSLVAVSGYRVDKLIELAGQRLSTIAIGIAICLLVAFLVFPVWAGDDLHLLTVRNMDKLADSLEGCVHEYFNKDQAVDEKEVSSQKLQGYKCVLNSKASEDSLANLARWEPAHGRFNFRHPYSQYTKIGAAMRYCAYCIEALNGCTNSDIQVPESLKEHLTDVCLRVSSECSKVLKDCGSSVKSMRRSRTVDFLVGEMKDAVKELHDTLKQPSSTVPLTEALPVVTIASLLIEITARVDGVVSAVGKLATAANFKADRKPGRVEPAVEINGLEQV